jgi:phytoene dehydrogenase-like protein
MNKIAGPVERVVVVGAGIARLAAASRLRQAGIDAVVLEARDRIGGRLHTVDLAGTPVDMGGSWIHHPIGNPLTAFCDDHGIARDAGNPLPSLSAFDMAERRRLEHAEVEFYAQTETGAFWDSTEALSQRLGQGRPRTTPSKPMWRSAGSAPPSRAGCARSCGPSSRPTPRTAPRTSRCAGSHSPKCSRASYQRAVRLRRRRLRQRPSRRSTPDVRRELDRVGLGEPCYVFHIFGCIPG